MLSDNTASSVYFFFNVTATTEIYTLSLHDALPISATRTSGTTTAPGRNGGTSCGRRSRNREPPRSEEHTSELQSHHDLVCRLLLEKKKRQPNFAFQKAPDRSNKDAPDLNKLRATEQ